MVLGSKLPPFINPICGLIVCVGGGLSNNLEEPWA